MKAKLKVNLVEHTPNPDKVVAKAAKLCYSKIGIDDMNVTDEEAYKFVNRLASMGHESPIEHVSFTFAVEGVSRSLTHQLVRHRLASYSQQSQRYVKIAQVEYIVPPAIANDVIASKLYIQAMEEAQEAYNNIYDRLLVKKAIELGVYSKYTAYINEKLFDKFRATKIIETYNCGENPQVIKNESELMTLDEFWREYDKELPRNERMYSKTQKAIIEDARYVFPNACETKICMTMNARTLLNFFHHRCCDRAQWEIRELANEMCRLVKEVAPAIFSKAGPNCVCGPCPEGAMSCGKVKEMREKFLNN